MRPLSVLILCLGAALPARAMAAQPACDALAAADAQRAVALQDRVYIHDCCDLRLSECLQQQPRCLLAGRMAENICRRVAAGQDDEAIEQALNLRARTMIRFGPPAQLDLAGLELAGDPEAPITLVEFAAPRGPHCARVAPLVYQAVTEGPLAGKVKLFMKVFPLRSNPHSKEGGLAFLAAHEQGAFWDFALHAYTNFEDFSLENQLAWAEALGLDRALFEERLADPALKQVLVASKRQGLENGVSATPAFFIDGHAYRGELENEELVDTLEEAWERSQGLVHEP